MFKKSAQNTTLVTPPHPRKTHGGRINQRLFKLEVCLVALLSFMFLSATAFGQGASASLTGTITDSTDAAVPGATVTVTNIDTGVATRATANNVGIYNFPSLQTGNYTVAAEASGFSRTTRTDVRLSVGSQLRLNIPLAVAGTVTEVQVTGSVESVILEAGASAGTVMQEDMIQSVPLVGNNLMNLISIMGGVTTNNYGSSNTASLAGVQGYQHINVVRDGVSVTEVRNPTGIAANTNINQEMIGEFRMVLAPVDAEMGRGAGQVQMTTRSGSNAFHGSGVWNIQNSALDAYTFAQKQNKTPQNWRNLNSYTLTASGPIIRNKTFFFATWEQQFSRDKVATDVKVMTQCARKGIYRYLGGTVPAGDNVNGSYNPTNWNVPSVYADGTPRTDGTFYNINTPSQLFTIDPVRNALHIESVFGEFTEAARTALLGYRGAGGVWDDCSGINITPQQTTAWNNNTQGFYTTTGLTGVPTNNLLKPNSYWGEGTYRYAYDPTDFVGRFLESNYSSMPLPNNFSGATGTDGLNTATYRWQIPFVATGANIFGAGNPDRKSITVKIDHNINNNHRVSGTYTRESFFSNDILGIGSYGYWPEANGGYGGTIERKPQTFVASLTSTLLPTLLNEARFGLSLSDTWTYDPLDNKRHGDKMRQVLVDLMSPDQYTQGVLAQIGAGEGTFLFHTDAANPSHPLGGRGQIDASWGGKDPRWTISDTVTWMKGHHSFKGGIEYRRQSSTQEYMGLRAFTNDGGVAHMPAIYGGLTTETANRRLASTSLGVAAAAENATAWQDLAPNSYDSTVFGTAGNYTAPYQMMSYYSGTINQVRQYFYMVPEGNGARWNDPLKGERHYAYSMTNQELAIFFKDDWKLTGSLTLNLGLRYEYYGVPHASDGRTLRLQGDSFENAFGVTKGGWKNWMNNRIMVESPYDPYVNGTRYIPDFPRPEDVGGSVYQRVGPGSPNPGVLAWNRDLNNFGPHVGFSWQLPWFGKGLTTLRGGWSISQLPVDTFNQYGIYMATTAGARTETVESFRGAGNTRESSGYYMDMTDLSVSGKVLTQGFLPQPQDALPLTNYRVGENKVPGGTHVVDENVTSPYVHSLNLSVTRQLNRALTLDVRYIGTMSRKGLVGASGSNQHNLNYVRYINNVSPNGYDLLGEMENVRKGGYQSPLLNSIIPEGALMASGWAGVSGSDQLLRGTTSANMAVGNYSSVAGTLATGNGSYTPAATGVTGMIARGGCLPEDREGYLAAYVNNPDVNAYTFNCSKGLPWNYFVANPQYAIMNLYYSTQISNYHSMQTQLTMRPTRGLNFQATYTWSRNISNNGYSRYLEDPLEQYGRDYVLAGQHRSHQLNLFGSYELPFGANGFFFRNASGAFKKAIEGWQLGWVSTIASGVPGTITGASGMWSNNWPDIVRPDLWDNKAGKIENFWREDGSYLEGLYFGDKYIKVLDRNICDPTKMSASMYTTNCEYTSNGQMLLRGSAPRALAYNSGEVDRFGNPIPMSYANVQEGVAKGDTLAKTYYDVNAGRDITPVIVFRNVYQGDAVSGNFIGSQVTGPGRVTFDLSMQKSIEFMEGKRFEIRIDGQNILNHPVASGQNFAINNSTTFGRMGSKTNSRTIQARLSLRF